MSAASAFLRRRWPAVALVASLVLNGFLIGMLATDALRPHRGAFNGERFARFELRRFDERLPKDAVDRIAASLMPLAPAFDKRLAKLRDLRARDHAARRGSRARPRRDRRAAAELRAESAAMQEAVQKATYDALMLFPPTSACTSPRLRTGETELPRRMNRRQSLTKTSENLN